MIGPKMLELLMKFPHFSNMPSIIILWPFPPKISSKLKLQSSHFDPIADQLARMTFSFFSGVSSLNNFWIGEVRMEARSKELLACAS